MANHGEMAGFPVDKGWAWMVLLGTTSMVIIFDGVFRSSGLFILQYQERFNSNASETTLVLTLFMVVNSVAGVFVMTVGMKYMSARTCICVGGLITSACYAICAFAKHIEVLIFFLGAVIGVGGIMIWLPMLSVIGMYFDKRRGLANSVTAAGASVGALTFGPLYAMMFEYYGFSGTMLLASGILLNVVAAACLMRPPEFYTRSKSKTLPEISKQLESHLEEMTVANNNIKHDRIEAVNRQSMSKGVVLTKYTKNVNGDQPTQLLVSSDETTATKNSHLQAPLLTSSKTVVDHKSDISDRVHVPFTSSGSILTGSISNVNGIIDKTSHNPILSDKTTNFLKTIFDMGLLKNPVFIHYTFFSMTAVSPSFMTPLFAVPFANDIGISNRQIGILMFVLGCMDLVGRLSAGFLLDRKMIRSTTVMAIVFLIMAVMNNLLRLMKTFGALIGFAVVQGCLSGQFFAVFAVILIEHIGASKFQSALGFTNLFQGLAAAICIPITGLLRDVTGAYYWTYHMLGGLLLLAAILAFTLPYTHKRHQRNKPDAN